MRQMIPGKHLGKTETYDMRTGKKTGESNGMMMMPARDGTCAECATKHEALDPHNQQSLFYQYKFFNEFGRWPTWWDAMSHCHNNIKRFWKEELLKKGIKVTKPRAKK